MTTRPHYHPYQDIYGFWVFTSPLGKHGPFISERLADQAVTEVGQNHVKRSEGDGAEAALLREHFAEL